MDPFLWVALFTSVALRVVETSIGVLSVVVVIHSLDTASLGKLDR